jgi:hypothetical protein
VAQRWDFPKRRHDAGMPQTEEARSKPLVGNPRVFEVSLFGLQRNS